MGDHATNRVPAQRADRPAGPRGRLDAVERQHTGLAVTVAVFRKFGEDQSTKLASMIAFWAFFSVFPLMLVFVTLLGFLLPPTMKAGVLTSVAAMFPLLQLNSVQGLSGTWWALVLGLVSALWSGLQGVRTAEFAFNSVWQIPYTQRPRLGSQLLRGIAVLATVGLGLVVSTLITGYVAGSALTLGWYGRLLGYAVAIALDVGLFVAAFRILTNRRVTTRDVLPGAVLSGLLFFVLQSLSSLIISRYLQKAESTYGSFATVITILWWLYLQSVVTLLGAQLNVVLTDRLHPRGVAATADTEPDRRAYRSYARERAYQDEERVHTEFPPRDRR